MGDDAQVKEEEGMSPPRGRSRSRSLSRSPRRRSFSPDRRRRRDSRDRSRSRSRGRGRSWSRSRSRSPRGYRRRSRSYSRSRSRSRSPPRRRRRSPPRGDRDSRRPPPGGPARVKAEAEEAIPCVGYEGRIIGRGGETIRRIQEETGARISIDRASGECVVSGSTEQVILGSAAVKKIIAEAGERGGGSGGNGGGGGGFRPPSGPFEAEETIPCAGSEGRVIGKGGETIRRLQEETGCRIDIEKGSGLCTIKGTVAAVRAGAAAVRRQIEDGDGGGGGFKRKRDSEDEPIDSAAYGRELAQRDEDDEPKPPPIEPDFGLSGALAAETNTVNGVTLVYTEPPEAKKPTVRWRLYVFKNGELQGDPLKIHQQSYYLLGRERKVVDIPTDHPSCSKQHAVIQFRARDVMDDDTGDMVQVVTPYILDLDSTNGTHLNGERIDPRKYYQLLEKDTLVFGQSTRDFVILNEDSK